MSTRFAGASWLTRTSVFATGDAVTMMAWCYPTALPASAGYANVLVNRSSGVGQGVGFDLHNVAGTTHWSIGTGPSDFDGTSAVAINVWKHLAVTRSGNTKTLYLDGRQEATRSDTGTCQPDLFVGDSAGADDGDEWIGRMAAIKIWRAALTAAEIKREQWFAYPVRLQNIVANYTLRRHARAKFDATVYRRDLTVSGTLTTEVDPPGLTWTAPVRRKMAVRTPAAAAAVSDVPMAPMIPMALMAM